VVKTEEEEYDEEEDYGEEEDEEGEEKDDEGSDQDFPEKKSFLMKASANMSMA